jgi:hypothetical protein
VIRLITEWRIQKRVEEQFQAFITGFHELIPADLVNVFDERELELLIGGIADIDVDDWKKHTDYRGYTENDEVIQNFWKCIRSWDAEQKSRLLQFATGTSRIPVNGFKDLQGSDGPRRFTIEKAGEPNQLPKSHTWYDAHSVQCTHQLLTRCLVSIVSICRRTKHLKRLTRNLRSLSRRRSVSDKNKRLTVSEEPCAWTAIAVEVLWKTTTWRWCHCTKPAKEGALVYGDSTLLGIVYDSWFLGLAFQLVDLQCIVGGSIALLARVHVWRFRGWEGWK